MRAALFAFLGLVLTVGFAMQRAYSALGATPVCDTLPAGTTTWTSAGSPFQICASGLTVPTGSTLVLDGASGPVEVNALGFGGIAMRGGTLQTANTTATNGVTFSGPRASAGSWGGLSFIQDPAAGGEKGNGSLRNVVINSANTAIVINSGATATIGSTSFGLVLDNVTIQDASSAAIFAASTPLSVNGSRITRFGQQGIVAQSHNLSVSGVTISNPTTPNTSNEGIVASDITNRAVSITNSTITGAGKSGITLLQPSNAAPGSLTLTGNTITSSGLANPSINRLVNPAIRLVSMTAGLGTGSNIDNNHGSGNGLDTIAFDGTATNSFTWLTPTNSATDHALGYTNVNGLTLTSGNALTLPPGAVVKTLGTISFRGSTLDATVGSATITSLRDNSVGLAVCPSELTGGSCNPAAGDWGGLTFFRDPTTTTRGNGALTGTTIKFPSSVFINSGATATVGSTTFGLVLDNVSISNTSNDAISGSGTPISVSGGSITNYGLRGINTFNCDLSVRGVTITNPTTPNATNEGIVAFVGDRAVSITNNTVTGAGTSGIKLSSPSNVPPGSFTLTGNTIRNSGLANPSIGRLVSPAIQVLGMTASLGTGSNIDGNHGSGNGLDTIAFHGTATNSFTWLTPTNGPTDHALGYTILQGLMLTSGNTLTLPATAIVKSFGPINFPGSTLDATAGSATITTLRDNSVGLAVCPSELTGGTCVPAAGEWGGLSFTQDSTTGERGNGALTGATIKFPFTVSITSGATSTPGTPGFGLVIRDRSTILRSGSAAISASGTTIAVVNTIIDTTGGDGISVSSSSGNLFNGLLVQNVASTGLRLASASAIVSRSRFTNIGGTTSFANFAISASGAPVTIECTSIHGNRQGVLIGSPGSSIRNSSLFGNTGVNRFDLDDPVAVDARGNWWGQATGPAAGQIRFPVNADTSGFLSSEAPTVTLALSDTNTNANGNFGTGTLTVTATFSRAMDTTIEPTVVIDPGAHPVTGSWQADEKTWIGTYALNGASAAAGSNTVTLTAAASCVLDPATNQVAPTSATFTADFSLASVTTNPATGVGAATATLNGSINPNGWATSGFFRFGTVSGVYTRSTPPETLGSGTTPVAFTAAVTGLAPSTQHFFVAVATTANGESVGAEQSFTTGTAVAPTTRLALVAPASATAGAGFSLTVTAQDAGGNTTPGYTGTVHFTSSDAQAVLPANFTFSAADAGVHLFSGVVLKTAGTQTVSATDTLTSAISGSASVVVSGAAVDHLVLAPASATITAGASQSYGARARDGFGNDLGDVTAATAFSIAPDGSCTLNSCSATVAGSHTVTGTHTPSGKTGTAALSVTAAPTRNFFTVKAPENAKPGRPFTITVIARDPAGKRIRDYTGTVHFSSSDGSAVLPADHQFVVDDRGRHRFSVTLSSVGTQSITVNDVGTSMTGSDTVNVRGPRHEPHFDVEGPHRVATGRPFSVTVAAKDADGHTIRTFTGTVHFSSTDPAAILPADRAFIPSDRGAHRFALTLRTLGAQTITVVDTADPAMRGSIAVIVAATGDDDEDEDGGDEETDDD